MKIIDAKEFTVNEISKTLQTLSTEITTWNNATESHRIPTITETLYQSNFTNLFILHTINTSETPKHNLTPLTLEATLDYLKIRNLDNDAIISRILPQFNNEPE